MQRKNQNVLILYHITVLGFMRPIFKETNSVAVLYMYIIHVINKMVVHNLC